LRKILHKTRPSNPRLQKQLEAANSLAASSYYSPIAKEDTMEQKKSIEGDKTGLAEQMYALQQRKKRAFTTNVAISWIVLLLFLFYLFSGSDISIAGIQLKTINLDSEFIQSNLTFIAGGITQTIYISALSIILATILALLAALGRLSSFPPIYALSTFYVSLIRGTPLYLQIFFFFLALPQLGIILPGLWAGVLALGLNYGAYMSEIFRAGLSSVGKGQREAALAIGMTTGQMMQRIVIPQALRFAIPPTGNEFIAMLKDSALVSATGFVHELMWRATKVGRAKFRNLESLIMAAVFYWVMTLIFTYFQGRLESRMARGDR
jgi:polar amino acid transport system permease protein